MSKKQDSKKTRKPEVRLSEEEALELEMILDRLSVQSPEGQSLESYIRSLRKALSGRENMVAALVEKLGKSPSEVGYRTFSGVQDLLEDRSNRRIARQVLYRFQQRGLGVASPEKLDPRRVILVQSESRQSLAHFSPLPEGFWLLSALIHAPGLFDPYLIMAYAEEGFRRMSVRVAESSPKQYREHVLELSGQLPRKPCAIPIWHMARLYWELAGWCGGSEDPSELEMGRQLLRPHYNPERLPHAYDLLPSVDRPEELLYDIDANVLLEHTPCEWLFLPKDALLPYWEKIQGIETSLLVVSRQIQEERTQRVIETAVDELCTGKTRSLWQRFFEEEAMWLQLSGKSDMARWAWITAKYLAGDARPSESMVCMKILGTSLRYHWPEAFRAPVERDGTDSFYQTDSGLIVPC